MSDAEVFVLVFRVDGWYFQHLVRFKSVHIH